MAVEERLEGAELVGRLQVDRVVRQVAGRHADAAAQRHRQVGVVAARDIFDRSGASRIHLSISHCRSHATATAVAEVDD
ncbi:hypothetical protein Mal64_09790 [Pseudobythopirellula maris]|uniref:Uncharacterized protein n=1 Tax=Pseudobythopirellula maris TaxID=2527991 RepID=A0A5C5ZU21_9BACT|nr:hypothetical protein Mal64_09790 [Pseudobythopirellula maris]